MNSSKGLRLKGVNYITHCSSCRTYNLSVCCLLLEIEVCLSFERNKDGNKLKVKTQPLTNVNAPQPVSQGLAVVITLV